MQIITDSETLKQRFQEHLKNNEKFYCCVAWAGAPHSFDGIKLFEPKKNCGKIEKMVVGTHFYQTSPEFIEKFRNNKKVRFIINTDGVFHSKIYLFKNSEKDWKAIIGSSNFTKGGFEKNTECNVEIGSGDDPTGLLLKQIEDHINSNWANGKQLTEQDLARYIEAYKKQKPKLDRLAKSYHATKHSYIANEFSLGSWEEYVDKLENTLVEVEGTLVKLKGSAVLDDRIKILKTIHSWFSEGIPFSEMNYEKRKCIAGLVGTKEPDWRLFGSNGNGKFKHMIKDDNDVRLISNALDNIPLEGEITKEMFNAYF